MEALVSVLIANFLSRHFFSNMFVLNLKVQENVGRVVCAACLLFYFYFLLFLFCFVLLFLCVFVCFLFFVFFFFSNTSLYFSYLLDPFFQEVPGVQFCPVHYVYCPALKKKNDKIYKQHFYFKIETNTLKLSSGSEQYQPLVLALFTNNIIFRFYNTVSI